MDVNKIRKIIQSDSERRNRIKTAKKYYCNENDILTSGVNPNTDNSDPLRNADNRICHNFHQLLVDEKSAYMFTYPVQFDLGNSDELNKRIKKVLGDEFETVTTDLCVEASNAALGWLHYWKDLSNNKQEFSYALVKTEQVIPIYNKSLKKSLIGVYRYYEDTEEDKTYTYFEHWTDKEVTTYKLEGSIDSSNSKIVEEPFILKHDLGEVPFIFFKNNNREQSDLSKYKHLIDLYDKVVSGFANDLEDIQQIIYILENYGGENLKEFLGDLKRFKAIKTESDSTGGSGGVKTLQIEIPVEARNILLEHTKKQIYESGQGLQQDVESVGNASGVALKFFYRKLELKAGLQETEFKIGFARLIRAIMRFLKLDDDIEITQTYTRNMISNDKEAAEIARDSKGIIPDKIIIKNHPWVENAEEAYKMLEEEKEIDPYENINKNDSRVDVNE